MGPGAIADFWRSIFVVTNMLEKRAGNAVFANKYHNELEWGHV